MRKSLNILIIAPHYVDFIKDSTESIAKNVNGEITVMVRYNILVEFLRYVPFGGYFDHLRLYTKQKIVDLKNVPSNVHVHLIDTVYFIPDGRNPRLGDKLSKIFEEYIKRNNIEFDIIHAHFTYPQGYVAVKLGQKFNVPVVITAHGYDVYEMPFRNNKWKNIVKWILEQAAHIITVSQRNKHIMTQKLGIDEKKISVIPNGYDSNKFKPMPQEKARNLLRIPQGKKVILNVGNLYPVKGHKYLIDAMKKVTNVRKDVVLYIIGSGSLRDSIQRQIKKSNLENYVKLVGAKPHDEIPLWMNAADLFVLPSLSEGNPTVMFEALGVGLPFVGTAVGGVPEIITSEDYGLLCPPANPECLAEKILIALEKEWDREKIRKYAEQFTWENIAKQTLEIYKKLLE